MADHRLLSPPGLVCPSLALRTGRIGRQDSAALVALNDSPSRDRRTFPVWARCVAAVLAIAPLPSTTLSLVRQKDPPLSAQLGGSLLRDAERAPRLLKGRVPAVAPPGDGKLAFVARELS
jgi:hypothetical protein